VVQKTESIKSLICFMSLFNNFYCELNLRRDEVLFRQVKTSNQFISNLSLYKKGKLASKINQS